MDHSWGLQLPRFFPKIKDKKLERVELMSRSTFSSLRACAVVFLPVFLLVSLSPSLMAQTADRCASRDSYGFDGRGGSECDG